MLVYRGKLWFAEHIWQVRGISMIVFKHHVVNVGEENLGGEPTSPGVEMGGRQFAFIVPLSG